MKKGETLNYLGYTIKNALNNDGIILINPTGNHCGFFGNNLNLAKKYAFLNYMMDKPRLRSTLVSRLSKSDGGGHYGDYSLLMSCLKSDGLEKPDDVHMTSDMNRMINLSI